MKEHVCKICNNHSVVVEHHITSKCYGGTNKKSNKSLLCPTCHSMVHYGKYIIEGYFFCTPNGNTLIWRKENQPSITGMPDPKVWTYKSKEENNDGTI